MCLQLLIKWKDHYSDIHFMKVVIFTGAVTEPLNLKVEQKCSFFSKLTAVIYPVFSSVKDMSEVLGI
jgi:hypothetical protein